MLLELYGKAGTLCEPARLGHQKCPLIVRPTSEDNITAQLVHALRILHPRYWLSEFLNRALKGDRFPQQVFRQLRIEPWVKKPPFPRAWIPWIEGGSEIDLQLTWENQPTTIFVECKYGSALSGQTNQNDGSHGYPSDQLVRNIRVGLHESGYYQTSGLFESEPRDFAVILLTPETGTALVREYRDLDRLKLAIPHSDRITWPRTPFVGEIGYHELQQILLNRRRFMSRPERIVLDALVEYLSYKFQTRPHRSRRPSGLKTSDPLQHADPGD